MADWKPCFSGAVPSRTHERRYLFALVFASKREYRWVPMHISIERIDPATLGTFKDQLSRVQSIETVIPEKLQSAICAVVDQLKEQGYLAEHVIVFMRQICMNVGLASHIYHSGEWNGRIARGMVDGIVTMCIDHYYAATAVDQVVAGPQTDGVA